MKRHLSPITAQQAPVPLALMQAELSGRPSGSDGTVQIALIRPSR